MRLHNDAKAGYTKLDEFHNGYEYDFRVSISQHEMTIIPVKILDQ